MVARVTDDEVKRLTKTNGDTTLIGIEPANLIVNEQVVPAGSLSDERLKMIELFLAAHFTTIVEERGGLGFTKTLEAAESYKGDFTQGLKLTRFGQQAIILDTTGTLADMATPVRKAQFTVV